MGHQASYYLTPADRKALEARLRARFDFVVFRYRSNSPKPHLVDSLYIEEDGKPVFDYNIARPEDLNDVVMRYVPAQKYWTAQITESPMVELDGSSLRENIFRAGRVYYVDGLYGPDGQWMLKSEQFRKWASKFLATVKRSLKKFDHGRGVVSYAGEEAAALLESGKAVRARG